MAVKKWYGIRRGRRKGVYDKWFGTGGAKEQIDGYKGAVYRGFLTRDEAVNFVNGADVNTKEPKKNNAVADAMDDAVVVYTDGGCINNPGSGGYGVVIIFSDESVKELSGSISYTTNNRMEMLAAIKALRFLKNENGKIVLHSDSSYLINAVNKGWLKSWVKKNWIKSDGKPVLNQDLWEEFLDAVNGKNIEFRWVKGHAGNKYNERCDQLANSCAREEGGDVDLEYEKLGNLSK